MKTFLSVLILSFATSLARADVEPIRFAPTRPTAAPTAAAPAANAPTTNTPAKSSKDVKAKKHTHAHHKKKPSSATQH